LKNQYEWHSQEESTTRRSNSAGLLGSSDSKKSVSRRSEDNDIWCRKGDGDDYGIEGTSPIRNQVSKVANMPSDNTHLSPQTKKRKPDERLLNDSMEDKEGNTFEAFEESPMALVPSIQEENNCHERMGDSETSDGSKKMKMENARLLE
jgi:hypothetical protein